jgi:transcriptional regulator GlxA family with amidase domain
VVCRVDDVVVSGRARSKPRRVLVVAFDGVRFLDVVGPLEVFTVADEQGDFYSARVATLGGRDVITTTGNRLGADVALEDVGSPNWSLLLEPTLVREVARLAGPARRVVSVCTGTFALAAAGLLDGKRAATHWRHAAALRRQFPTVEVDPEALFVRDGKVFSSAGIAAGMDLALALVEDDLGAEVARIAAKVLVVFLQRPGGQSQFSVWTTTPPVRHEPLRRVLDAIALDPSGDHSIRSMAARANFSERHLTRLFEEHVGSRPGAYVERIRLEIARAMLEAGDESLALVAKQSGLGSEETLRRSFIKRFGVSPGAYRAQFRTTGVSGISAIEALNDLSADDEPFYRVPVSEPAAD